MAQPRGTNDHDAGCPSRDGDGQPRKTFERGVVSALALVAAAVCVYAMRRADPDLWGYLVYGRLFIEHGGPVSTDPFAYTSSGYHWVTFEYLAQILLWEAYHVAGPLGLIVLKCLVGGLAVYFLFVAVRATSNDPFVWVPVFAFATSTVSRYFLFRPQLFTFAFFALYTAVLMRFLLGRTKTLWILPAAMLGWANLHGGFLAGLGLLCVAIVLRICQNVSSPGHRLSLLANTQRLWATLLASFLATFVNPQGPRLWSYVLTEVFHSTNRRYVDEWRPTLEVGDYWTAAALVLLTVGLALIWSLTHRRVSSVGGLPPWLWVLSCAPLMVMAYISVRHVPIATIWVAPVVALLVSSLGVGARQPSGRVLSRAWLLAGTLACLPAFLTLCVVYVQPLPRVQTSGDTFGSKHPCGAVTFMRQAQLSGNVYNPLWWGSYITWQLYPRILVSMDGRNVSAFPDSMVIENLRFYSEGTGSVDLDAPVRYDTDFLLIPSDRPVLQRVRNDTRWRKIFADQDSALFVRADRERLSTLLPRNGRGSESLRSSCPDSLR